MFKSHRRLRLAVRRKQSLDVHTSIDCVIRPVSAVVFFLFSVWCLIVELLQSEETVAILFLGCPACNTPPDPRSMRPHTFLTNPSG